MDLVRYLSALRNNKNMGLVLALALLLLCFVLRYYSPLRLTYVAFYPAIMLATVAAGRIVGICVTIIAAVLASYFFIQPAGSFALTTTDIWGLAAFLIVSMIIVETSNILSETLVLVAEKSKKILEQSKVIMESERVQGTLLREISHRMKNQYAVILAMARSTAKTAQSVEEFQSTFTNRLHSLSRAHDLLIQSNWRTVPVEDLIKAETAIFAPKDGLSCTGQDLKLNDIAVVNIGMALHELATNSAKYGAWSRENGKVHIDWQKTDGTFSLSWREISGFPATKASRKGFGTTVLEQVVPLALGGSAILEITDNGLEWKLAVPAAIALGGHEPANESAHAPIPLTVE